MNTNSHTVIVGAGHAGGAVAHQLRQLGFQGQITLVGDEGFIPYQRPPLSKAWLKGAIDGEDLALRPESYYSESGITCHLSDSAHRLDRDKKVVFLESGMEVHYDYLVVATGAKARTVEAESKAGIVYLRNMNDAVALRDSLLVEGLRVAILGAGFIGLEVAATARLIGADVTVIERGPRVLNRVASDSISEFFRDAHEKAGVHFVFDMSVERFEFSNGQITGVVTSNGTHIDCDLLLVGIGAIPNDAIAQQSGLICDDGIIVDAQCRTSDPCVFAVGDVTRVRQADGVTMPRLESVPNALEQAKKAASAIVGAPMPKDEIPWFWSDQYEFKLQMVGLRSAQSEAIVRKTRDGSGISIFHVKDGRLEAAETINEAKDFLIAKRAISTAQVVNSDILRDSTRPVNEAFSSLV